MGADGHFSADFLKAAGAAAVGHYLTSPNFSAFQATTPTSSTKREAKFGGDPLSAFHAQAYDATNMLFAALEKVAVENADGSLSIPKGALRDAIFATKDFAGLTGTLSCTPTGDCGAPVIAVYQITQADVDAAEDAVDADLAVAASATLSVRRDRPRGRAGPPARSCSPSTQTEPPVERPKTGPVDATSRSTSSCGRSARSSSWWSWSGPS